MSEALHDRRTEKFSSLMGIHNTTAFSVSMIGMDILRRGGTIRIAVTGRSMNPIISNHDVVVITSAKRSRLCVGDIVVYSAGRNMVCHRIIRMFKESGKSLFLAKGDASYLTDPPLETNHILGEVVTIEKPNYIVSLKHNSWRKVNYLIAKFSLLSTFLCKDTIPSRNRKKLLPRVIQKILFLMLRFLRKPAMNFLFTSVKPRPISATPHCPCDPEKEYKVRGHL